ncbi:MAG TPA: hypothetical protein VF665_19300 [Longimicrobium sp.]|jgi:hypothetical protein|uniref:hypothetical protein n=1 Tax=Longimicrobium sp. TaxID=2029185 RepID=UPI002EDAB25B
MSSFEARGQHLRSEAKAHVLAFLASTPRAQPSREGVKQAEIFKACGFDWGNYPKASSSNQQYRVVALLRELETEGRVEQIVESGPRRLR